MKNYSITWRTITNICWDFGWQLLGIRGANSVDMNLLPHLVKDLIAITPESFSQKERRIQSASYLSALLRN